MQRQKKRAALFLQSGSTIFLYFMSFIDGNQIPLLHIIVQYFYQILLSMRISIIIQILKISGLLQNIFMNLQEN